MSMLLFSQTTDTDATVVVDTLDTRERHCSKLTTIPHIGAIVAGRGRSDVTAAIVTMLQLSQTFDEAAEALPAVYSRALHDVPEYDAWVAEANGITVAEAHAQSGVSSTDFPTSQQILLVGISKQRGCVHAVVINRLADGEAPTLLNGAGCVVGPEHAELQKTVRGLLQTDAGARSAAQTLYVEQGGKPGFGGRVIVARVSVSGITIQDLGVLEEGAA